MQKVNPVDIIAPVINVLYSDITLKTHHVFKTIGDDRFIVLASTWNARTSYVWRSTSKRDDPSIPFTNNFEMELRNTNRLEVYEL